MHCCYNLHGCTYLAHHFKACLPHNVLFYSWHMWYGPWHTCDVQLIHNWHTEDKHTFNGAGGSLAWGWSKSRSMLFLIEEDPSYQLVFTGSKNFVPSQSYIAFWNLENTGNYSTWQTLIVISQKWPFSEFQNLSSPTFFIQSSWNLI